MASNVTAALLELQIHLIQNKSWLTLISFKLFFLRNTNKNNFLTVPLHSYYCVRLLTQVFLINLAKTPTNQCAGVEHTGIFFRLQLSK